MRHDDGLHHKIIVGKIDGKEAQDVCQTTFIKNDIYDAGLIKTSHVDMKRLANNKKKLRERGRRLQN